MKQIYIWLLMIFCFACTMGKNQKRLNVQDMAKMMADLKTAEAYSQTFSNTDSAAEVRRIYIAAICRKYNTSLKRYNDNVAWYLKKPKLMDSIFNVADALVSADLKQETAVAHTSAIGYFDKRYETAPGYNYLDATKAVPPAFTTYNEYLQDYKSREFYTLPPANLQEIN